MKVIISGATGFVGKNLSNFLQKSNIESFGISLRNSDWHTFDWNKNFVAIIHLAGKAHDTSNASNPDEYFKINYNLTKEVFDKFLASTVRDFFYFSSVKAVADSVEGVLEENYNPQPQTPYGMSKMKAENYLLEHPLPEGKRLFIIRPCMIHGPGNKGNLNLLFNVVKKGLPWPLASFDNQRSFLSIDNLSYLVLEMIKKETINSGIYNFADDIPLSTNELVSLIADSIGKERKLSFINPSVIHFFAKIGDVIPLPLNSERLKKLTESYIVSNTKIKRELKIESLPVSSVEGLRKTILSFDHKV
ncbi:NAD-dependent epimerase/dehydratase family protein [Sphingobacterium sp.]|uniref:NAD-dependent epimerase/dehydratase family protein n=1 Tax=Sphingobacterium sp. TaxID=341027 RepID=UPI00289EF2ED|nr:NAD-dependent epimerase/dehydratase family protein [Sphingobacterium sp.]